MVAHTHSPTQAIDDGVRSRVERTADGLSTAVLEAITDWAKRDAVTSRALALNHRWYARPVCEQKMHDFLELVR